jgi:hypothetical protein
LGLTIPRDVRSTGAGARRADETGGGAPPPGRVMSARAGTSPRARTFRRMVSTNHLGPVRPTGHDLCARTPRFVLRKAGAAPSDAPSMIAELRAFYAFLGRAHGLDLAPACNRSLGPTIATRLASTLGDRSKLGTAKAVVALGLERGVDMNSREGIEGLMRSMEGQPLPASIRLPAAPPRGSAFARGRRQGQRRRRRESRRREGAKVVATTTHPLPLAPPDTSRSNSCRSACGAPAGCRDGPAGARRHRCDRAVGSRS